MYAVTVLFEVSPDAVADFLRLVRDNAAQSLRDEPGCQRFDVCHDADQPQAVFLYEIYDSPEAFAVHLQTPHFKAFDAAVAEMVTSKSVHTYREVST